MLHMLRTFLLMAAVVSASISFAQKKAPVKADPHHDIENTQAWKKVKTADILFNQHSYYNAIDIYKEVHDSIPENKYVTYRLALAYYIARDFKNSEKYFARSAGMEDAKSPENAMTFFYYGESLKMNAKYAEAKIAFLKFYKLRDRSPELKIWKTIARNEFKSCSFAQQLIKGDTTFTDVKFLEGDINHAYTDFSPFPKGSDTLIYASLRQDSVISYGYNDEKFFPVRLFESVREGDTWSTPQQIVGKINHKQEHTANPVVTADGNRMYYTRCVQDRNNKVICHLYYADKLGDSWGQGHKVHGKVNSHDYTTTQPTLGYMLKRKRKKKYEIPVLYFMSDRPGGIGGKDIWYSEIDEGGNLSLPINCGKRINTVWDEVSPHYDNERKTLYFSSNYHYGLGGLDVFKSRGHTKRFTKPENMGIPVNSSYDDTYYIPEKDTNVLKFGYLVSNRPGGIALTSETCCDDIYRFEDYMPPICHLAGYLKLQEQQVNEAILDTLIAASASTESTAPDTLITQYTPQYDTILNFTPITDVRYGIVKQRHIEEAKAEGKEKTVEFYDKWITWIDTTDATGLFEADLVIGKHYSIVFIMDSMETHIENLDQYMSTCPNVDSITIGVLPPPVIIPDSSNNIDSTAIATNTDEKVEYRESLNLDIETEDLKENDKFVLDNMYFEFDKDVIKDESLPSVELLLMFMESHEDIKIELSGHTDSKGNDAYNEDLSDRRARSVRQMLIDEGINPKRIVAKGYGEKDPIAPNTKKDGSDNPAGRALNRRSEVTILSTDWKKDKKKK